MTTKEVICRFVRDGNSVITGNCTDSQPLSHFPVPTDEQIHFLRTFSPRCVFQNQAGIQLMFERFHTEKEAR